MTTKLVLLMLVVAATTINALVVDTDLKLMKEQVENKTVEVTGFAADENPNTLTEQQEIGKILEGHVQDFDNAYDTDLKNLAKTIETARQNADIGSASALCYKLQLTKIDPIRENGVTRAKAVSERIHEKMIDLGDSTKKLIDETRLDLAVKTIVQLCMKIYTGIGQDKERLKCFDDYGVDLSIAQKSKGEGLLERVGTIQQQTLRISDKNDEDLRSMFAANQLDYSKLNQEQIKCSNLPGSNTTPAPTTTTTPKPSPPTPAPTTASTPAPTPAPPKPPVKV